jgi:hypothetical protein
VHIYGLLRHHGIDAVGLAAHVLVDPVELNLELLRAEAHRAQHTESARFADRRHDVAAMREGEDRILDPESVTQRGSHLILQDVDVSTRRLAPTSWPLVAQAMRRS